MIESLHVSAKTSAANEAEVEEVDTVAVSATVDLAATPGPVLRPEIMTVTIMTEMAAATTATPRHNTLHGGALLAKQNRLATPHNEALAVVASAPTAPDPHPELVDAVGKSRPQDLVQFHPVTTTGTRPMRPSMSLTSSPCTVWALSTNRIW